MNTKTCSSRNFLLSSTDDCIDDFLNLAIKEAEKSNYTMIISSKYYHNLQIFKILNKSVLKHIIIMYFEDIDKMIIKLFELRLFKIIPTVVILDFDNYFLPSSKEPHKSPTKQKLCLLISSLLNYMQYLERIDGHLAISIVVTNENRLPDNWINLLVDLYYYKSAYSNFISLMAVLPFVEEK